MRSFISVENPSLAVGRSIINGRSTTAGYAAPQHSLAPSRNVPLPRKSFFARLELASMGFEATRLWTKRQRKVEGFWRMFAATGRRLRQGQRRLLASYRRDWV